MNEKKLQVVEIAYVYKTKIWIEDDMMGARHVMLQHETCEPFTYCSFHYDYRYTSNAGTHSAAQAMAFSLGATEPIERRSRAWKFLEPERLMELGREMKAKEEARRATLPPGTCPECDGDGEQGGQFCGSYWKCEACAGSGKTAP